MLMRPSSSGFARFVKSGRPQKSGMETAREPAAGAPRRAAPIAMSICLLNVPGFADFRPRHDAVSPRCDERSHHAAPGLWIDRVVSLLMAPPLSRRIRPGDQARISLAGGAGLKTE